MGILEFKNKQWKEQLNKINPLWYLLIGVITMSATHLSYGVNIVGWICMTPFLIYLTITKGWKSRLLFVFSLIISWSFIVLKIITPPIPLVFLFMYSIPISLFHLPGYLLWSKFKDRRFSILLFPVLMTVMEWV